MHNTLQELDLSRFKLVPPPQSCREVCRIQIDKNDLLRQNDAFHKSLQGKMEFQLRLHDDGTHLLLLPDESPNLVFSRRGVVTHHLFGNILRKLGLEPPLSFQMTWNEQNHCWVGEYEGISAPTPAVTCPVGRRKHRTRRSAV